MNADFFFICVLFSDGIGRKAQRKLMSLQKRVELAEMKEKTAYVCLKKVTKELEKTKLDKDTLANILKARETEVKQMENKCTEENIKLARMEEKFQSFKEKASAKLAQNLYK